MILRTVTLENFGLYAGTNVLDLMPQTRAGGRAPIVLIGGKNGAGKTTLLEAVRLALYGKRALGARVGRADYEAYLRSRVHRTGHVNAAAVALDFDYAEAGAVHRYSVRREWAVRGKTIVETLLLEKDGAPISSVPREEWHHFLQELIPPGVSQLFFFDGEKISEIAEGEAEDEHLADAIRGLLGIELVGRLRADLGLYLARHLRDGDGEAAARLEAVNRDLASLQRQAEEMSDLIADLASARESQARAAERVRRRFVAEGGEAAMNRARIELALEETRREISRLEHELRDLANKLLPFAFAPKLVSAVRTALQSRGSARTDSASVAMLGGLVEGWRSQDTPKRRGKWSAAHWADLERLVATLLPDEQGQDPAILRELGDGAAALDRLTEVERDVRPRAHVLRDALNGHMLRLRALETELARADTAATGALLEELKTADQRVGASDAEFRARSEELKLLKGNMVTLERERRRLEGEQAASARAIERAGLAARAAQALADYEQRLLDHKLSQLRSQFVFCFNQLARKSDLIADIDINPETFATALIDKAGRTLPKSSLSAGEKQIYAIAMLWALARTSGRPLPMIIDTPLARLDSEHRAKLTHRYFPAASHQVVLLSTDTELDEGLARELGAAVSHSYRLDYDREASRTFVSRGYFDDVPAEPVHALQQA